MEPENGRALGGKGRKAAKSAQEKAADELTALSEELGLYDGPVAQEMPPQVNDDAPLAQPMPEAPAGPCPVCGMARGTCGHRPGGPA